ncbi:MAG: response regulator [Deltaproteobacteria bacterium]|jgi:signal transduction histidine kinase/CheY-like chemotaxis protein|nr:response regulator [Deltaproteobacteria bacterium]
MSAVRPSLTQLLVVCAAFFTLSMVSYFYVSDIMKHQVDLYSGAEMEVHRSRMRSLLYAHESALRHAAAFVAFETERGAGPAELQRLMQELTEVFSTQPEMEGAFVSVYGFIDGNYLDGKSYIPGELFYPSAAPWLRGALETDGIFHSRPYIDPVSADAVAAVSMVIRQSGGEPIGVIAIDYFLTPLIDRVRSYRVADTGWGFLLDDSFSILTFPEPAYLNRNLSEYPGFESLALELMEAAGPARAEPVYSTQADGSELASVLWAGRAAADTESADDADGAGMAAEADGTTVEALAEAEAVIVADSEAEGGVTGEEGAVGSGHASAADASAPAERAVAPAERAESEGADDGSPAEDSPDAAGSEGLAAGPVRLRDAPASREPGGHDMSLPEREGEVLVRTVSLDGSENIVFFSTLENGWHMGIVAPFRYYYAEVFRMFPVILLLGAALSLMVCFILLRMSLAKRRSEDESHAKSSFLARMSHEIRTPMNSVLGMCELARQSLGKPEAAEYIAGIGRAGTDLLAIINDILDLSSISAGATGLKIAPYLTADLLADAVAFTRVRMVGRPVEFHVEADPLMPCRLAGDRGRVGQVLTNMLSNAVKYTPGGHITFKASFAEEEPGGQEGETRGVRLVFRVEDTGIGIRREDLDTLFEEFVRLDQGGVKHIEGTGLGLAISRSLCRVMGGDISVASEFGRGSVFTAGLVQQVVDGSPMGALPDGNVLRWAADGPTAGVGFSAPGFRALVVDDIETNLVVAKGLLEFYGMDVEVSQHPALAVELCAVRSYDLLFMDHMMPVMDGIETLARVRALGGAWEKVPAVALTAAVMEGNREMFLAKGFDGFLGKPITVAALEDVLERFVPASRRGPALMPSPARDDPEAQGVAIEGIDAASGIRRMSGRRSAYVNALSVFVRDLEGRRGLVSGVDPESLGGFRIQVHAIKSAAANVGAVELSREAAILEELSSEGDLAGITRRLSRFTARLDGIVSGVRAFLAGEAGRSAVAAVPAGPAGAVAAASELSGLPPYAGAPVRDGPGAPGPAGPTDAARATETSPEAPVGAGPGAPPAGRNEAGAAAAAPAGRDDAGGAEASPAAPEPDGGNGTGGATDPPRMNVDRSLLVELKSALSKRDVRAIDRLLETIGAAAGDPGTREAVERISTSVLLADYREAELLVDRDIA